VKVLKHLLIDFSQHALAKLFMFKFHVSP